MSVNAKPPPDLSDTSKARASELLDWLCDQGQLYPSKTLRVENDALEELVGITFDVAKKSGSAGLSLAMHYAQLYSLVNCASDTQELTDASNSLAAGGKLIASVASEPQSRGDILSSEAVMRPVGDRIVIEKQSFNTSYVPDAGAFLVTATEAGSERPVQRLVLAHAEQTEMQDVGHNRMLGMQDMDNRAWRFTFEVAREQVFALPFPEIARRYMTPASHVLWSACWSGIAASALGKAARTIPKSKKGVSPSAEALALSDLRRRHDVVNVLIRDALKSAASAARAGLNLDDAARLNRLKITASQDCAAIVLDALRLIGFRAYAETGELSLSEEIRDILSAQLMVSNTRLASQNTLIDRFAGDAP